MLWRFSLLAGDRGVHRAQHTVDEGHWPHGAKAFSAKAARSTSMFSCCRPPRTAARCGSRSGFRAQARVRTDVARRGRHLHPPARALSAPCSAARKRRAPCSAACRRWRCSRRSAAGGAPAGSGAGLVNWICRSKGLHHSSRDGAPGRSGRSFHASDGRRGPADPGADKGAKPANFAATAGRIAGGRLSVARPAGSSVQSRHDDSPPPPGSPQNCAARPLRCAQPSCCFLPAAIAQHAGGGRGPRAPVPAAPGRRPAGEVSIELAPLDPTTASCRLRRAQTFLPAGARGGRFSVGVRCDSPVTWTAYPAGARRRVADHLIAARPLRGQVLGPADLGQHAGRPHHAPDNLLTTPPRPAATTPVHRGRRQRRPCAAMLRVPTRCARPDRERARRGAGFRVASEGRAMNNAALGEKVGCAWPTARSSPGPHRRAAQWRAGVLRACVPTGDGRADGGA